MEHPSPSLARVVGDRLAKLRIDRGWSQERAAREAGVTYSSYQKWELGRNPPNLQDLISLANTFGTTLDYLSGRSDEITTSAVLPRGWLVIDQAKVDGILASSTPEEIERFVDWDRITVIRWESEVPQDYKIVPARDFAETSAQICAHIERVHAGLARKWLARFDKRRSDSNWLSRLLGRMF